MGLELNWVDKRPEQPDTTGFSDVLSPRVLLLRPVTSMGMPQLCVA